jgi:hypothetical protein
MSVGGCLRSALKASVFALSLFMLTGISWGQTSPEEYLGFRVGTDRKLAGYDQIQAYFEKLDQESPKLTVVELGPTTLGKSLIMAVITSETNMARLERYREIAQKLKNSYDLSPEQAAELAKEGKVIVAIDCNIHSTEIASSQMSMELAYRLVTGRTPFDADEVLDEVIFLLMPSINPDGQQMVTDWYRKYVGTEYEGGRMPWLYHHYAGHDDNRDYYMFNLAETRAVGKAIYHDWLPQILLDEHQMGSTGARLFISPYMDPALPDVHPLVWRGIALTGAHLIAELEKNGFQGVVYGENYTGWWTGGIDEVSWPHNIVSFLSEMASVKVATPIYIEPDEIGERFQQKRMTFPSPWPGGWWRLADLVNYELTFSFSLLRTAALLKEDYLYNYYLMNKQSIDGTGKENDPFAYIVSPTQHDTLAALKMLEVAMMGGIEVRRAEANFVADQKNYPSGTFVILLGQPYRPYVKTLLAKQTYPDMREYEEGPPIEPYDNTAWTLPMQMGVMLDEIHRPFSAKLQKINEVPYPVANVPPNDPPYFVLDPSSNATYGAVFALLKQNAEVRRATQPIESVPAGGFVIKNDANAQRNLPELLDRWHLSALGLGSLAGIETIPLKNPRIGVYQSWASNMDEGWLRYVLEDFGIPFLTLDNEDMKQAAKEGFRSIDVLVLASEDPEIILHGQPPSGSPAAARFSPLPPEYQGGIGEETLEGIQTFVGNGGILVTLGEACKLALREFKVPARAILDEIEPSEFFLPSSIVRLNVDTQNPVALGMPEEAAAMFAEGVIMDTRIPPSADWDRRVVARYPEENILMSGWLIGEKHMAGKAAVVDVRYKKGRILLNGIRTHFRGQSHGTFKFLFNSLLYPESESVGAGTTTGNSTKRSSLRLLR